MSSFSWFLNSLNSIVVATFPNIYVRHKTSTWPLLCKRVQPTVWKFCGCHHNVNGRISNIMDNPLWYLKLTQFYSLNIFYWKFNSFHLNSILHKIWDKWLPLNLPNKNHYHTITEPVLFESINDANLKLHLIMSGSFAGLSRWSDSALRRPSRNRSWPIPMAAVFSSASGCSASSQTMVALIQLLRLEARYLHHVYMICAP